jgi:hypothetical protein
VTFAWFGWRLQELLDSNAVFHFSNPTHTLFAQLRKGLLDPKLAAYRDGLNFLQQAASRHQCAPAAPACSRLVPSRARCLLPLHSMLTSHRRRL